MSGLGTVVAVDRASGEVIGSSSYGPVGGDPGTPARRRPERGCRSAATQGRCAHVPGEALRRTLLAAMIRLVVGGIGVRPARSFLTIVAVTLGIGDPIALATPSGVQPFVVVGVVSDRPDDVARGGRQSSPSPSPRLAWCWVGRRASIRFTFNSRLMFQRPTHYERCAIGFRRGWKQSARPVEP